MTSAITTCGGILLRDLTRASLQWLHTNVDAINALNVFPIPDGDTGTNMLLTMRAAVNEIEDKNETSVSKVAHAISHGALMGARGNSGVILSQVWRGLARGLDDRDTFSTQQLAIALREATETAYRGVVKPVEGTILTVSRDLADAAETIAAETFDLIEMLGRLVEAGEESVARTPDLLPVLKDAGVVDSGGKGLVVLFEGMHRYMKGEPLDVATHIVAQPLSLDAIGAAMDEIEPGQEWEVIVDFRPGSEINLRRFYDRLLMMGTSIQVGEGDELFRMHIHLLKEKRYEPIEYCESLGTVVNVHMENLIDQLAQASGPGEVVDIEPGQILVVAVSPGVGFTKIFKGQAVAIVAGGQSMNPSTQDILKAFEDEPTDKVIILPNNKNIQLAAEQAAEISVKQVRVIPARTLPQGIAAMLSFNPDGDLDAVVAAMHAALDEVETGEVTTATRSVELDGVAVSEGQFIGLHNGKLAAASDTLNEVVFELLDNMDVDDLELVTLFYGGEVDEDAAQALAEVIEDRHPGLEIEVYYGGQPHYHYIFSAE